MAERFFSYPATPFCKDLSRVKRNVIFNRNPAVLSSPILLFAEKLALQIREVSGSVQIFPAGDKLVSLV